ncbi:MAG TPA: hypothetical protein VGK46_09325, partial [Saprospiraceae bacterium]
DIPFYFSLFIGYWLLRAISFLLFLVYWLLALGYWLLPDISFLLFPWLLGIGYSLLAIGS